MTSEEPILVALLCEVRVDLNVSDDARPCQHRFERAVSRRIHQRHHTSVTHIKVPASDDLWGLTII